MSQKKRKRKTDFFRNPCRAWQEDQTTQGKLLHFLFINIYSIYF